MELGAEIEVEDAGGVALLIIASGCQGLVEHAGYFQKLRNCRVFGFVDALDVELQTSLRQEEAANLLHEIHAIVFLFNVIGDVGIRLVALHQPVERVGHQFEVRVRKILHRDELRVAQRAHHLAEITDFTETHF